jgi:hypothetical protein
MVATRPPAALDDAWGVSVEGNPTFGEPTDRSNGKKSMRIVVRLASLGLGLISSTSAWACTLCHSRTAEQVRAAVFGPDFWSNVGMLVLPLPVLLVAVVAVRRSMP